MVKKIVADIMKYGSAKRAYLGVMYGNDQMSAEDRRKNNIREGEGVYVLEVAPGSAADAAGVKKGDFITHINGLKVSTGTEMIEKIAALRPGDKISLTYQQNGRERTANAELKGDPGSYESLQQPNRE
jgi:S1-C subfamily serine protease